jgi:hypothetical protein
VQPLAQQLYDRALASQRNQEIWSLRWQQIQREEGTAAAQSKLMSEYQDSIGAAMQQLSEVQANKSRINAETFDRVLAALPDESSRLIQQTYRRSAFPNVYMDREAAEKHITGALELQDLTGDQRSSIIDLRAEYSPAYEDLCQRMLTTSRDSPAPNPGSDDWQQYQEYQDRMARLRFERRELNSRALLRLHQTLTAEQIEAMGGLPDVSDKADAQPVYW